LHDNVTGHTSTKLVHADLKIFIVEKSAPDTYVIRMSAGAFIAFLICVALAGTAKAHGEYYC
jgi:hypothetical protein